MSRYTTGWADHAHKVPFACDPLTEIASLTKLFTTEVLSQASLTTPQVLNTTLGSLTAQIGAAGPGMQPATLGELGDFTSGLPLRPPVCPARPIPGVSWRVMRKPWPQQR